jgi:dTDP-4-amino-4,6-dideoxygalactose transaminase
MSYTDMISHASPRSQYLAHQEEIDAALHRVLLKGRYVLAEEVEAFEREMARFLSTRHAIGVGSGTAALEISLRACNIGPGDEVITTAHTAVATVAAIESIGATPVLVDIEQRSFLLDGTRIEKVVSPRTKAIVPVHLYGQSADLSQILLVAHKHRLVVIEDCAQAIGASFEGKLVGTWGNLATFSFYPTKNLGAIGDGGLVVTEDSALAARVSSLREYGWQQRYISAIAGTNSRLDELQAAILRVKLPYLDRENERRISIARRYSEALSGLIAVPHVETSRKHIFHLYVIRTPERDNLQRFLRQQGVDSGIHYPVPVHLQPAYIGRLGDVGSYPVTEAVSKEILSLPVYPELSDAQCEKVIGAVRSFFGDRGTGRSL